MPQTGRVCSVYVIVTVSFHSLSATLRSIAAIIPSSIQLKRPGSCPGFFIAKYMARTNPRHKNGNLRRKYRARLKAQGGPCGICRGRLGPIHYDEPSDAKHPLSFVIDEIIPVSRWREFGYESPEAVAQDWGNLQAAHWICNQQKSNRVFEEIAPRIKLINVKDGEW